MTKQYVLSREEMILDALRKNPAFKNLAITPSYLDQRRQLSNNTYSYVWNFKSTDREAERPEVKLGVEDVFIVLKWKFYLAKITAAQGGAFTKQTYPNAVVFGATAAEDLMGFYNNELRVKVDTGFTFDPVPMDQFYHVPETVQQAAEASVSPAILYSSLNEESGLRNCIPGLVLNGKRTNEFEVRVKEYTTAPAWAGAGSGTEHYAGFYLRGFKVSSAAESHYDQIMKVLQEL